MQKGLGKGLGALFGDLPPAGEQQQPDLNLPIQKVEPNPQQPRKNFDPEELQALADSIALHGVIQPLTVRRMDNGFYQIIAGERRWRAARLAGLQEIPAVVIDADDEQATELALIENLQRQDLNPVEEALGYRRLLDEYGMTQEKAAERVGKSRPAVANALRLLSLPDAIRALLEEGKLSAGHGRALLTVPDSTLQKKLAQKVVQEGLSVRQTEAMAKRLAQTGADAEEAAAKAADPMKLYRDAAAKELSQRWGRKVSITKGPKKGKVEFEFYNDEDLTELLDKLEQSVKGGSGL